LTLLCDCVPSVNMGRMVDDELCNIAWRTITSDVGYVRTCFIVSEALAADFTTDATLAVDAD
jgi:hypothetical protein